MKPRSRNSLLALIRNYCLTTCAVEYQISLYTFDTRSRTEKKARVMDGREKNERNFNYDWGDYACTHNLWRITRSSIVTLLWVVNRGGGRLCLCPSNWKINLNLMGSHSRIVQWNENSLGLLLLAGQQRCQSINRQFVRLFLGSRSSIVNLIRVESSLINWMAKPFLFSRGLDKYLCALKKSFFFPHLWDFHF